MARYSRRGGARSIAEVPDVKIETPQAGEFLSYDDETGAWVNQTPADLGVATTEDVASKPNLINTDGDSGNTIYIGSVDPASLYTLNPGDVWIDNS